MATASRVVTDEKTESSTSHHRYFDTTTCTSTVCGVQIPRYSKINKVTVKYDVKRGGVNLSTSNADARIMFADSYSSIESEFLILGKWINEITTSYKEFSADMTKYCYSQTENAGAISLSAINNHTKLYFSALGILIRKYYTKNLGIYWDYTPPTYTLSLKTSGSGSVSGGGTFNVGVTDQTKTITATPSAGYKFVKWVDSNGNTYNTASVNVTVSQNSISAFSTTVTYTAYFELDKINKIYVGTSQPKEIYVGTQKVKAVYVGTTKIYG